MNNQPADAVAKVNKIIREILDNHKYKDQYIRNLSRKKIMKVISALIVYAKILEHNAK